ncbi:MAG: RDD family protein [Alphaproteobacteria bacterium]|nr:RDD family protein [Alphaproteobacteria bacterium]
MPTPSRGGALDLADLRAAPVGVGTPAGFARRTSAATIDALIVVLFVLAWSAALVLLFGLPRDRDAVGAADLPYFAGLVGFPWLYCAGLESGRRGATLGKRLMGLCVCDRRGEPLGFGRASLRWLARLLTIATAMLGWFLILLTPHRQALHDLVAGTMVVDDRGRGRG